MRPRGWLSFRYQQVRSTVKVSIFVLSFVGCSTTFCAAENPLGVKLEGQQESNWCWAATGAMIMDYHGRGVTQCKQACNQFGRQDCCNPSVCDEPGWPEFAKYGFSFKRTSNKSLSKAQIQNQIDNGRPVAFTWHWLDENGKDEGRGHMMVIVGYATQNGVLYLRVNNPLPVNQGNQIWITYDYYDKGSDHSHWDDFYDIQ